MTDEAIDTDPATQVDPNVDPTAIDTKVDTPDVVDKTETVPVDDGIMGEKVDEKADETPKGAPEKYEAFDVSSGEDIGYKFTDEQSAEFGEVAKKLGLDQEQANNLVKFDIERQRQINEAAVAADKVETEAWHEESRKEHGDKYSEVIGTAKKVWDSTLMPAGTRTLLSVTNLNHNPHILNLLNNIGKSMSEDTFVPSEQKVKGKNEGGIDEMCSDLNKKT